MSRERIDSIIPDLFSVSPRDRLSVSPNARTATVKPIAKSSQYVLPNDLQAAIEYLDDQELHRLFSAVTAERERRGSKPTPHRKTLRELPTKNAVSLTSGKSNAVKAAFEAGVPPAKIAREFGISQADLRKVIAGITGKVKPRPTT